jgi:hypothetical protein
MSDGGLKHLETLHKISGGIELPHGRHLKLDSARSSATTKAMRLHTDETSKSKDAELENETLPDPHEILRRPISKRCREKETIDLASDSDTSIVFDLTNKQGSLKSDFRDLQFHIMSMC